jgi:glycosyltransferase involved in cell wall biosynthesis
MMHIGIDARSVHPGHGGIGTYVRELVGALTEIDGTDHYTIFRAAAGTQDAIVYAPNVTEVACAAGMLDWRWEQLKLPTLIDELDLDVVHMTCFAAPLVHACPVVTTVHDVVFRARPDLVDPGLATCLDQATRLAAQSADHLIAVSEHARESICSAYGVDREHISVTHEAPARIFRPVGRQPAREWVGASYGVDSDYVLYVGALEPKKNLDGLLEAFSQVRRRLARDVTLVMVGGQGGMRFDVHQALALHHLHGAVRVLGRVPEEDLPLLYSAASVFVYPSFYEGFGLPPLEAMACGTPTVVSNATSLPEVVGSAAWTVDPEDVTGIAEAIAATLTDGELAQRLSRDGLRRARDFSWQETARRTRCVYEQVAASRRGASQCAC